MKRGLHPLKQAARWVAMLPAALGAALLSLFPVHWAIMLAKFTAQDESGPINVANWPAERLEALAAAFLLPLVFVAVGAKVAPRGKPYAAGGLALGWLLVYAAGAAVLLTYVETSEQTVVEIADWEYLQIAGVGALNIAGALVGFFQVLRPDD